MEQPHQLRKNNRNCATHSVILVVSIERVTSARITSAYLRVKYCALFVANTSHACSLLVAIIVY